MTKAKIHNIVVTTELGKKVYLETFLRGINKNRKIQVMYELEQFPAAIIRFRLDVDTKVTILLYATGKLICVGSRNMQNVFRAIEYLVSMIKQVGSVRSNVNSKKERDK